MVANSAKRRRASVNVEPAASGKTVLRRFSCLLVALVAASSASAYGATPEPKCGSVKGNPELAIKVCTRLIEFAGLDRPDLAKAYFTRAAEWSSQGKHDRAILDLDVAIELDPSVPGQYLNRALALSETGEHERAIRDYAAAIKLSPDDTRMYIGRAVEFTVLGDYKRAQADYEEVIRRQPKNMSGHFGRGRVRFYAGDFMQAASDFLRAHQLDSSIYTALWLFLARKRADIPGEQTLAQDAGTSGAGEWPEPVVALYLGKLAPDAVQKAAAHPDPARQRDRRCEANFYIGEWHLTRGERDAASRLLNDARSGCQTSFLEHEGAVAELRRLSQKP
jgi:lipoprotein NlpI